MRSLDVPLSESDSRSLSAGDIVDVSGTVITMRDEAHLRALETETLPFSLDGAVVYHCGPIMEKNGGGWRMVAGGPTTSARMNALTPELLKRYPVRAIIGKGGMSHEVLEAMKARGCVYLSFTGGAAVLAAAGVRRVAGVHWEDLGMPEAAWELEADHFGPLVVAMDASGRSLYDDIKKQLEKRLPIIRNSLGF